MRWIFKAKILLLSFFLFGCQYNPTSTYEEDTNVDMVKRMATELLEARDATKVDDFYNAGFVLETNNRKVDFAALQKGYDQLFKEAKSVKVDFRSLFAKDAQVVAYYTVTIMTNKGKKEEYTAMSVMDIKQSKINSAMQVVYPDTNKL